MSSGNQTLEDLFRANAKWAQAVVEADPDFFKKSAGTPQTPQVSLYVAARSSLSRILRVVIPFAIDRCCGSVARTRGFQSLLSRIPGQETYSSTGTSPSTPDQLLFCLRASDWLDH